MSESLNLRIEEGREFHKRSEALRDAIKTVERAQGRTFPSIQEQVKGYFEYLLKQGPVLRNEPGTMAEFAAVMRHHLPIPGPDDKVHPLTALVADLSALYASQYLNTNGQQPHFYTAWKKRRASDFAADKFTDALPLFRQDAQTLIDSSLLDRDTKALVLELKADVLPQNNFNPDKVLGSIEPANRLTHGQLLALQIWQRRLPKTDEGTGLYGNVESGLKAFFTPLNGTLENTLLYWIADPDPKNHKLTEFSEFLFNRWGWLNRVDYRKVKIIRKEDLDKIPPGERLLYERFQQSPKSVVKRAVESEDGKLEEREFPYPIGPKENYAFTAIPILPVGGSEVGKTSFLCAFTDAIIRSAGGFQDETKVRSTGLLKFLGPAIQEWENGQKTNTIKAAEYKFDVSRPGLDPRRFVRMEIADYPGEFTHVDKYNLEAEAKEVSKRIKGAHGIFFFFDGNVLNTPEGADRALALAPLYQQILRDVMLADDSARRHIPIAFVINKADILFGKDWFEQFGTTRLVPEGIATAIDLGTGQNGEPTSPFGRFRNAVHYNAAVSRHHKSQERVLKVLECFKSFFEELLRWTYRYQILLTTSARPAQGVTEAMQWMLHQLLPIYSRQAQGEMAADVDKLKTLAAELAERMAGAEELTANLKKLNVKLEKRLGEVPFSKALNKLIGDSTEALRGKLEETARALKEKLDQVCVGAGVAAEDYPANEKAPFTKQAVVARAAIEGLKKQAMDLEEWRKDLDCLKSAG